MSLHKFCLQKLFELWNKFFNKIDLTSFLNWLKLSNYFIFKGKHLCNLTPMCNTLFWSKDVLQDCVWRSYLLLALCSCISQFCLRSPLYFFMKHKTSKTYVDVTVRILFSLNFCLQDSYFFIPVIILITFLWIQNAFILSLPPPPSVIPYVSCEWK